MFDATTQTPTLIGCNLLTIHQTQAGFTTLCLVFPAAISEALNYDTTFGVLSKSCKSFYKTFRRPLWLAHMHFVKAEADCISGFPSKQALVKNFLLSNELLRSLHHGMDYLE